ncbi:SRPBCC family protein [Hoyosella sp. G463]|uniref:SRPBCC family protein n=1 Tax=Lolliginicoccus lacisalsi TaxID=2742202 RepID=A0A927PK05_9ACTN|nr:SRPBCC family protein [Lolliginicoccus lacisalsi]MBD8505158.1 SRPBCC family protein [Lolliginicoccus lacisalsi]
MADTTYTVERTRTINAPAATVYAQIADLHAWRTWSPWENLDENLKREYSGPRMGAGARYAWSGNRKAGEGEMVITDAVEPTSITMSLAFTKPMKSTNELQFTIGEHGATSTVTWTMTGQQTLLTRATALFGGMNKILGKQFTQGLDRLAAVVETD